MSKLGKDDYPVKWIRAKHLSVRWAEAQRGLNQRKVERIKESFDPDAVGVLIVTTENGDGKHHVIDGQHRHAAIEQLWGENEYVPCQVIDKKDPAEAADIWLTINTGRSRPSAIDRFHVAVTAGHDRECEVNDLLDGLGYTVGLGGADGTISAISACLSIHKRMGVEGLRNTLLTIRAIWGMDRDAYHNSIIRGMARFLAEHGENVDRERLVSKVAKRKTPARLIGAAKALKDALNVTTKEGVKMVLVQDYNHGLRGDRLEES